MNPEAQPAPTTHHHDFFDVYKLALEDLHATRDLGQKIDGFYLTIITLLLTADAYEFANARYDQWAPTFATIGVALIGIAVTARWLQGAGNLYVLVKNRYDWLREAEDPQKRPEMGSPGAAFITRDYQVAYQSKKRGGKPADASQRSAYQESKISKFHFRTILLQSLCILVFILIPTIIGALTTQNLRPDIIQAILSIIP